MDFDHPGVMFSGLLIGAVGMGIFIYGKKETNIRCLAVGATLCVFPYFVTSMAVLWLAAAACIGGLYAWCKWL